MTHFLLLSLITYSRSQFDCRPGEFLFNVLTNEPWLQLINDAVNLLLQILSPCSKFVTCNVVMCLLAEIEELSGRLKASRQRVADLERNFTTASNSSQKNEKVSRWLVDHFVSRLLRALQKLQLSVTYRGESYGF